MADDLSDTIEDLAQQPKIVSGDAGSVEMPSIPEVIEAAKFGASTAGASKPFRGMRVTKLSHSGPT